MWIYKGKEITSTEQTPPTAVGFVYKITHLPTGQMYIGKKNLQSRITKKLTKKEISEHVGKGRKPRTKKVIKESNWLEYRGSSKEFLELTRNSPDSDLIKEILCFCATSKSLTYHEVKYQISLAVLEKKEYVNSNISGKFYAKDCEIINYEV